MILPGRSVATMTVALAILPSVPLAQSPGTPAPPAEMLDRVERRFPQPVRVGDLPGRKLLGPSERQPVLGRVAAIVRSTDGRIKVVVRLAGWFWEGDRSTAIPIEAVALLGEHVALLDITAEQLRGLPRFDPATASAVAEGESIRVGLAKPFH